MTVLLNGIDGPVGDAFRRAEDIGGRAVQFHEALAGAGPQPAGPVLL